MERFVFVAAVTIAIIFGLGAVFGGPNFHLEFDGEAGGPAPIVDTAPGRLEPQTFVGDDLRLRHLAAVVTITPEDRTDFLIEITSPGGVPMPTVAVDENKVIIDGQLRRRIGDCSETGVELRGYDTVTTDQLPRITIRAPRTLRVSRGGAGSTEIAAAESVDLELMGCSSVNIAEVTNRLDVELAGSGRVSAVSATTLDAELAGSGDVDVGTVSERAEIDIAGSGTVTIATLNGELSADGAGSGNVSILGGALTNADIDLAGSGDVDIAAPVQTLTVSIVGSGDVDVAGAVGDIDADIAGSGGVRAQSVTGAIRRDIIGSGEVEVGPAAQN